LFNETGNGAREYRKLRMKYHVSSWRDNIMPCCCYHSLFTPTRNGSSRLRNNWKESFFFWLRGLFFVRDHAMRLACDVECLTNAPNG
jgi:hypothetical protein